MLLTRVALPAPLGTLSTTAPAWLTAMVAVLCCAPSADATTVSLPLPFDELPFSVVNDGASDGVVVLPERGDRRAPHDVPRLSLERTFEVPGLHHGDGELAVVVGESTGDVAVFVNDVLIGHKDHGAPRALPFARSLLSDGVLRLRLVSELDPWYAKTIQHVPRLGEGPWLIDEARPAALTAALATKTALMHRTAPQLLFAAVLILAALYHLMLFTLHRSLQGYVWYAVVLGFVAAWAVVVGTTEASIWPAMRTETMWRIAPGLGALGGVAFVEFAWRTLFDRGPPKALRMGQAFLTVTSLLCFVPGAVGFVVASSAIRLVGFVIVMGATFTVVLREAVFGDRDARAIVVGFGVLGVAILRQIAGFLGVLQVSPWPLELVGFFGLVATMGVALAQRYARTLADLDQTNAAIARFVPFKFLSLLHRESVRAVCIGDNVKLTMNVMFCDIRGFTTLAEAAGPDATFQQINRYLSMMEPEILKEGGYINQYLGDGIMSLFHTAADNVVAAAVGMLRALELLNVERGARGEPLLRIGVGINTGPLMLGTIGGREQLNSGVVGDAANLAARVEGMTKIFGATVLVTESTVRALSPDAAFALRELDTVRAQGKRRAVTVFEVLDAEPDAELRAHKLATRESYAAALRAYRRGDFAEAEALAHELVRAAPADGPATRLAALAAEHSPAPPEGWDGVTVLVTK